MFKFFVVIVFLVFLCETAVNKQPGLVIKPLTNEPIKSKPDTCLECINWAIESLDIILNEILDGGIIANCGKACSGLKNPYLNTFCTLLCDALGLDEFIHILNKSDLNPLYYCQLVHMCIVEDCTEPECVKIYVHQVRPEIAPEGSRFEIETAFTIVNTAGAGMLRYEIYQNPKDPISQDYLIEHWAPRGNFTQFLAIDTKEQALKIGTWTARITFCEGMCGSKHPHTRLFDTAVANFTVTKKK